MNNLTEGANDNGNDAVEDLREATGRDDGLAQVFVEYFKRAGILIGVWGWGYMRMSSAWLLMGLFFYCGNEKYKMLKEKKRNFLKTAAKEDEKKAILSSVDELPSWVYFPDVERCEWLNKIIKQMWPFIGEYFRNLLETTVLASVQSSLPSALKPFKFGNIQLGDIPPRIGGVKVYIENVKRNEIYMDVEINYASDCNVKMNVKGMNLGIKDLMLHGTLRVIMKPLVNQIPIIGGYTFFFLNQPTLDFDLTGVSNILDLPVISNTLRSLILEQISNYMVPPNKLAFPMVVGVTADQLRHPLPDGVMRLNVIAGKNLKSADVQFLGKGKSDPYCKILVGADKYKTKVIQNTCNPHWDDTFDMIIDQKLGQYAEIMVFDEDPGEDDELGSFSLDIQDVESNGFIDSWFPLENVKTGVIHLKANFLYLSKEHQDIDKVSRMSSQIDDLASVLVMVTIDSASSLKRIKKMLEPTPYVKLGIGQKEFETKTVLPTTNPRFEETFQFLIHNINSHDLDIEVMDKNKGKSLGSATISLQEALTSHDMTLNRPFPLHGGESNSQITVQIVIRILSEEKPKGWAKENLFKAVNYVLKDSIDNNKNNISNNIADNNNISKTKLSQIKTEVDNHPEITISSPVSNNADSTNINDKIESDISMNMSSVPTSPVSNASSYINETNEVRKRINTMETDSRSESMQSTMSSEYLGKVQLTIRYSQQRSRLIVAVHKCIDLLACDSDGVSDPYVRLYLLPDRSNHSKRKTQTIKDNLAPIFDEKVEWTITHEEAIKRTLEIGVKNAVSMFSKNRTHIGKVYIDLQSLDLNQASTNWYDLQDGELMKHE